MEPTGSTNNLKYIHMQYTKDRRNSGNYFRVVLGKQVSILFHNTKSSQYIFVWEAASGETFPQDRNGIISYCSKGTLQGISQLRNTPLQPLPTCSGMSQVKLSYISFIQIYIYT